MGKIIDYKIVHEFGCDPLAQKVRDAIMEGWQPIGGVCLSQLDLPEAHIKDMVWAQALVKYED